MHDHGHGSRPFDVHIIGGGLAGCEAAWQVARRGGSAVIYEMKPKRFSPAHLSHRLAELVCSNSLKSTCMENASGLLKAEMRLMGSLVVEAAEAASVPAGASLAVDRALFSSYVTDALAGVGVNVIRDEITRIPDARPLIIATGPLTSDAFAASISAFIGAERLYFYDAVAPIVTAASIDMSRAFMASRYGKGEADYLNCPMTEPEYQRFYDALIVADTVSRRSFEEERSFQACMPIEAMAQKGPKTLLFGPMRPVGLKDPATGKRPFAVVQLRKENASATLYNIVGFQTRMTYNDQKEVFRLIPALAEAEFVRLGKLHRNTYIDSPRLLLRTGQLRKDQSVFFAGQITGVEGYCESAMSGLYAGINALRLSKGEPLVTPPDGAISGALLKHISDEANADFQPMNANMGLLGVNGRKTDKAGLALNALKIMKAWLDSLDNN
ncbi:MAG: methylenetetrahydrofolate--tRNA-(uracil(54)-C(5))-methyltransferase (FADH(2)-oxidizing) TrmFO [Deltaproteobacteria bacterium]|nr:methylenetetrahydrofolate--tRNA-(uracil(54)-C(5))-methyltransferase (FADH(2)-oxidizing) TrmFO [Deltaproteobacteria bacterium]